LFIILIQMNQSKRMIPIKKKMKRAIEKRIRKAHNKKKAVIVIQTQILILTLRALKKKRKNKIVKMNLWKLRRRSQKKQTIFWQIKLT
jgi:hypothetical protein